MGQPRRPRRARPLAPLTGCALAGAWLLPALAFAQADAGVRWSQHPRIVAVREAVAELDGQVVDAGSTWGCALISEAERPRTVAEWKKFSAGQTYPPLAETVERTRSRAGALERVTWRWTQSGVHEWEYRDGVEVTRWSRAGAELFTLLSAGGTGRGSYGLQVKAWSDAAGARFWWAVKDTLHPADRERVGPTLPTLPAEPTLTPEEVRSWLAPDQRLSYLRPCTREQAAQVEHLANSPGFTAAELTIARAIWVKRSD